MRTLGRAANAVLVGFAAWLLGGCAGGAQPGGGQAATNPGTGGLQTHHGDHRAVWGAATGELYVVGAQEVLHRSNAGQWGVEASDLVDGVVLEAVWGSGPDDVWAVGERATTGVALHRGADHVWHRVALPVVPPLHSVWGSGPDDLYLGSDGFVLHSYDGRVFDGEAFRIGASVRAVWGRSATEVYAVGGDGSSSIIGVNGGNGEDWVTFGASPVDAAFAIGGNANVLYIGGQERSVDGSAVARFDGTTWRRADLPHGDGVDALLVAGNATVAAAGDVLSVRANDEPDFDASQWQLMATAVGDVKGLWGTSADDFWAVGHAINHVVKGNVTEE